MLINDLVALPSKKEDLDKFNFATTQLERIYFLNQTNIDNREYGGAIKRIAKVKNSNVYLAINSEDKTIGIMTRKKDIKNNTSSKNENKNKK